MERQEFLNNIKLIAKSILKLADLEIKQLLVSTYAIVSKYMSMFKSHGIPLEIGDLITTCYDVLVFSRENFNPKIAGFTTFYSRILSRNLCTILRKYSNNRHKIVNYSTANKKDGSFNIENLTNDEDIENKCINKIFFDFYIEMQNERDKAVIERILSNYSKVNIVKECNIKTRGFDKVYNKFLNVCRRAYI